MSVSTTVRRDSRRGGDGRDRANRRLPMRGDGISRGSRRGQQEARRGRKTPGSLVRSWGGGAGGRGGGRMCQERPSRRESDGRLSLEHRKASGLFRSRK